MSSNMSNYATIGQNFMNNIVQVDQQNCIATSTSSASDNVVIINGANISGNFTGITVQNSTDASCLMVSNMDTSVSNILTSTLQQTNQSATDIFNGFSFDSSENQFNIQQSVTNNISQINEATCAANTITTTDNNYIYLTDVTIGRDFFGVSNTASANANCTMNNTMKAVTYNQAQASASQSNTQLGMWAALLAAVVLIGGIIVIGTVFVFATGGLSRLGIASVPQKTQQEKELEAAQTLGLTPEVLALATGKQ